jgi:hypothetical protein
MSPDHHRLGASRRHGQTLVLAMLGLLANLAVAQSSDTKGPATAPDTPAQGADLLRQADADAADPQISPIQRIERAPVTDRLPDVLLPNADDGLPSIDGTGNDISNHHENAAGQRLRRRFPAQYGDGQDALAGSDRPSAREVSNRIHAQSELLPNALGASDFLWQWGQFIDHDLDLTDGVNPAESAPIPVPAGDPWFDPESSGAVHIAFNRSIHDRAIGTVGILFRRSPRQQINEISGWLDGSMVYGSDPVRAAALRSFNAGRLATSAGDLLPFNDAGLPNAGGSGAQLFLAGDVRANEQAALTAMHTLFVREHNWWAGRIAAEHPELDDEQIYQRARMMVVAEIQAITYREFLPRLLGAQAMKPYRGYDARIDARIANVFSTAAFRIGHSLLSPTLLRLDPANQEIDAGHLPLRDAFFGPQHIIEHGIEPLLRGLAAQRCQELDIHIIDDVRNFLFGAPGQGGFDLPALNIQRGRDHGLPGYAQVRAALGLGSTDSFADLNPDPAVHDRFAATYHDPSRIDLWSGLLAEPHVEGTMVGPTLRRLLADQFQALRDGDRFHYLHRLDPDQLAEIQATRLSDIIRRNTDIGTELRDDVFMLPEG